MGHLIPDPPYILLVQGDQRLREEAGQALYGAGFVPLLALSAADAENYMAGASVPVLIVLDLDTPASTPQSCSRASGPTRAGRG